MPQGEVTGFEQDPLWFKDAIIYELHVRAFADSNNDGMGDFPGLTRRLDYLQDLGVTTLWVLPFSPSPWKDDGYDTANYTDIHPAYGSLKDFQTFLREAHRRGLRVITELVLNHTSDQHVWFQRSRRAQPRSHWRNFYVWSDSPERYREARIIFKDFETSNWTWDPVAKAYYWHRFYSHQPDLNYDNPVVRTTMLQTVDFWFDMGVDGLRLDAVPYLFEREGTNCENLPETHDYLKDLRRHIEQKYRDRMLLAEANQWPEDAIAYFGSGDECHMAFHFPIMPRLFMSIHMEDRYPLTEIMRLTPPIPDTCQWALFLRNHDELTLEMVTDEERDYMYRVYASDRQMRINLGIRRRLAPLLGNDRRKIELMKALLLSLPGTPVLYYGDEIGMGDNFYLGDRNGVRTPMQWTADRNAGFSAANPQRLYLPVIIDPAYHYESLNVEGQRDNPHSLLWWTKRLIAQRRRSKAFGRGSLELLTPENRKVLAFLREYEGEQILVVANLSRFAQSAELDLSRLNGMTPVEMFGRSEFPAIGERPYFLSLGPYAFYWFALERKRAPEETGTGPLTFTLASLDDVFAAQTRTQLARILPNFLRARAWYLGRGKRIRLAEVADIVAVPQTSAYLLVIRVEYTDGDPDNYLLPLSVASGEKAGQVLRDSGQFVLAHLQARDGSRGVLYGSLWDREFHDAVLTAILKRSRWRGESGEVSASHTREFRRAWGTDRPKLDPSVSRSEHRHTNITYGDRFILKMFRKMDVGPNPEIDMDRFLTEDAGFAHAPALLGSVHYQAPGEEPAAIGVLHEYVAHEADCWHYTLDHLSLFFERALTFRGELPMRAVDPAPGPVAELIGSYLEMVRLLARRTAEMHIALASETDRADFVPEPFTDFYRQGLYHGMLGQVVRGLEELRRQLPRIPEEARPDVQKLLDREANVRARLLRLRDTRVNATRTRIHGDYQLPQVLFTGKDFVIIDFEGDPSRPVGERRIKRSPLRDVASMLRSLHYVAHSALFGKVTGVILDREKLPELEGWAGFWYRWVSDAFLRSYLSTAGKAAFVPTSPAQIEVLLDSYLIERAVREISYEIVHRPEWLRIPVRGILELV